MKIIINENFLEKNFQDETHVNCRISASFRSCVIKFHFCRQLGGRIQFSWWFLVTLGCELKSVCDILVGMMDDEHFREKSLIGLLPLLRRQPLERMIETQTANHQREPMAVGTGEACEEILPRPLPRRYPVPPQTRPLPQRHLIHQ